MIEKVLLAATLLFALASGVLGIATSHYKRAYASEAIVTKSLQDSIERQNLEADKALKKVLAEKKGIEDANRVLSDTILKNERAFNEQLEILRTRPPVAGPVRVRVVPGSCGPGGDGGAAKEGAGSGDSRSATDAATGVLAPEVVRRIDGIALEVEQLQGAFNACKAYTEMR